jgi:hypothetical protein
MQKIIVRKGTRMKEEKSASAFKKEILSHIEDDTKALFNKIKNAPTVMPFSVKGPLKNLGVTDPTVVYDFLHEILRTPCTTAESATCAIFVGVNLAVGTIFFGELLKSFIEDLANPPKETKPSNFYKPECALK